MDMYICIQTFISVDTEQFQYSWRTPPPCPSAGSCTSVSGETNYFMQHKMSSEPECCNTVESEALKEKISGNNVESFIVEMVTMLMKHGCHGNQASPRCHSPRLPW